MEGLSMFRVIDVQVDHCVELSQHAPCLTVNGVLTLETLRDTLALTS